MDAYPRDFWAHNRPFIVLSGLVPPPSSTQQSHDSPLRDDGVRLVSDLPPVLSETAHQLRDCILDEAGSNDAGDDRSIALSGGRPALQVAVVGRVGLSPYLYASTAIELPSTLRTMMGSDARSE